MAMLALGMLASCSKESTSTTNGNGNIDITGKTTQEVFMMQPWRSISWKDSSSKGTMETFLPCQNDDVYKFTSTTSYTITNNTKCDPTDPSESTDVWSMADPAGKELTFMTYKWTVESMTSTNIVMRRRWIDNQGNDICWRLTFAK